MTKIDIISGFLGAGKTTLIKKLINDCYKGEKIVLIENEFGEIGIDGGFLQDAGINITEMNSGCICCSLVGDFGEALKKVLTEYAPDRILIEPSGVGKLSDVIKAVQDIETEDAVLNAFTTVCDAGKCKMYIKNFGEFYINQVEHASTIILSHTGGMSEEKVEKALSLIKEHNSEAVIVTTPWDELSGQQLLDAIEGTSSLKNEIEALLKEHSHHHHHDEECGHHHHDHDEECECGHHHHHDEECECGHHHHNHDEECECGHHHHHDEECECGHHHHHDEECECSHHHHDHDEECECSHHHHDHDEECECGHHHHDHDEECECGHHHHDHDEECECGHHHHDHDEECECGHHHHHHHADEVFTSWGKETAKHFTASEITEILKALENEAEYGIILRAKGIVSGENGEWIHFDYVPGEPDVRTGSPAVIGRLCVIGSKMKEEKLGTLFGI